MTTYRHVIFLITVLAFLAVFLPFIPGCGGVPVKSELQIVYSQRETSNPNWRPPSTYTVQTSEGWDKETGCAVEIKHEKSGILLRFVPAGEFDMGSNEHLHDWPVHKVKISKPFYIGKYEVTNEQYCVFLNAQGVHFGDDNAWFYPCDGMIEEREGEWRPKNGYARHPVIGVTWSGAKAFSEWVKGRLPSEAEWEYACRAGSTTLLSIEDDESVYDASVYNEYAWYRFNSGKRTHEAGTRKPNDWGLYDMQGNVSEWCEDVWHDRYRGAPDDGSAWTTGWDESERVVRGGAWDDNASFCRSTYRWRNYMDEIDNTVGFRIVVAAEDARSNDEVLDDMKFENTPTIGPVAREYFAAKLKGEWEKVWDMLSSKTQKSHEQIWEAAKSTGSDEEKEMANKAGSAKEYYVLRMKKTEKSGKEEKMLKLVKEDGEWKIEY